MRVFTCIRDLRWKERVNNSTTETTYYSNYYKYACEHSIYETLNDYALGAQKCASDGEYTYLISSRTCYII